MKLSECSDVFTEMLAQKSLKNMVSNSCLTIYFQMINLFSQTHPPPVCSSIGSMENRDSSPEVAIMHLCVQLPTAGKAFRTESELSKEIGKSQWCEIVLFEIAGEYVDKLVITDFLFTIQTDWSCGCYFWVWMWTHQWRTAGQLIIVSALFISPKWKVEKSPPRRYFA